MARVAPVTFQKYNSVNFQKQDINFSCKKENVPTSYTWKYKYDSDVVAMLSTCAAGLLLLVAAIKLRSTRMF